MASNAPGTMSHNIHTKKRPKRTGASNTRSDARDALRGTKDTPAPTEKKNVRTSPADRHAAQSALSDTHIPKEQPPQRAPKKKRTPLPEKETHEKRRTPPPPPPKKETRKKKKTPSRIRHEPAPKRVQATQDTWEAPSITTDEERVHPVRTYVSDAHETVTSNNESLASIRTHAKQKKKTPPRPQRKKKGAGLLIATIVIFIAFLGGIGGGVGYYYYKTGTISGISFSLPFFNQEEKHVRTPDDIPPSLDIADLSGTHIYERIRLLTDSNEEDGFHHIPVTDNNEPASSRAFLSRIAPSVPNTLLRSLENNFSLGAYADHPFILLEVTQYSRAYTSMLMWESSGLASAIAHLSETTPTTSRTFSDIRINETPARVAVDGEGDPLATYGFIHKTVLVITDTPETFRHILHEYSSS